MHNLEKTPSLAVNASCIEVAPAPYAALSIEDVSNSIVHFLEPIASIAAFNENDTALVLFLANGASVTLLNIRALELDSFPAFRFHDGVELSGDELHARLAWFSSSSVYTATHDSNDLFLENGTKTFAPELLFASLPQDDGAYTTYEGAGILLSADSIGFATSSLVEEWNNDHEGDLLYGQQDILPLSTQSSSGVAGGIGLFLSTHAGLVYDSENLDALLVPSDAQPNFAVNTTEEVTTIELCLGAAADYITYEPFSVTGATLEEEGSSSMLQTLLSTMS